MGFKEAYWIRWIKEPRSHVLHEQSAANTLLHQPAPPGEKQIILYVKLRMSAFEIKWL